MNFKTVIDTQLGLTQYFFYKIYLQQKQTEQGYFQINAYNKKMILTLEYALYIIKEKRLWEKCYLPSFSLANKTVLDLGAGCGETAIFFLYHGAKKIICIENNPIALNLLQQNKETNNLNLEITNEIPDLNSIDFMKCDIEGNERQLLKYSCIPPSVIETHTLELQEQLCQKFKMKPIHKSLLNKNLALISNSYSVS